MSRDAICDLSAAGAAVLCIIGAGLGLLAGVLALAWSVAWQ